ncbi:membrane associated rhomboid family serine protease [Balneicella halophila]|uniref:Membrane associated rhomboid family serine protease n=2 Tax=Balneicella halophila TaxID=1537566 RepID=A0A7L4UQF4_BALHA|nr:membrane associated rhomboid family serine protease [Balneicella halophila]
MQGIPPVVKNLLIINTLLLFGMFALERMNIDLTNYLGLFFPGSKWFLPHQFVTSMFMHANFSHLFFNMFALFMFGRILETVWGGKRFLIYYMVTGVGAVLLHSLVNYIQAYPILQNISEQELNLVIDQGKEALMIGKNFVDPDLSKLNLIYNVPVVGASGAVFGILLAFGMLFPNTELMLLFPPIPIKAKYFVIGYGVLELYFGVANFQGDNVAHFAHLGGMLFGFILLKYWKADRNKFY